METDAKEIFKSDALHKAVTEGDVERVRRLLDEGADIEARDFLDHTPLHAAVSFSLGGIMEKPVGSDGKPLLFDNLPKIEVQAMLEGRQRPEIDGSPQEWNPAAARLLLERGANVHVRTREGTTPLHLAAGVGATETARLLLEFGANIDEADKAGETPLMNAAQSRRLDTFAMLLEAGADSGRRTPQGGTTLFFAAQGGRTEIARLLLERGVGVNVRNAAGMTALTRAALSDRAEMVALLKEAGAEIGFLEAVALGDLELARGRPTPPAGERAPYWGQSVLTRVTKRGSVEAVKLLMERQVPVDASAEQGASPLMAATMRNSAELVSILLKAGAAPSGNRGPNRMEPLHWAANCNQIEIARLLLEHGADVDGSAADEVTPLAGAVMYGNLEMARLLLEAGADPNGGNEGGLSPLAFASVRKQTKLVKLLLEHGAKDENGFAALMAKTENKPDIEAMLKHAEGTILHELVKADDLEAVQERLSAGDDVNAANRMGMTALHFAAGRGHVEIVRLLQDAGADVGLSGEYAGTALTTAALADKAEIVSLLIEAGAKIGTVEAAVLGELELLRRKLDEGAGVDEGNGGGMTPLMGAAAGGKLECAQALLTRGANINVVDQQGQTALHHAVHRKRVEMARFLLDRGADVNLAGENQVIRRIYEDTIRKHGVTRDSFHQNTRAATALFGAVVADSAELVGLLLDRGADVNVQDNHLGDSPVMWAARNGHVEMIRLLVRRGADINAVGREGATALSEAVRMKKREAAEALIELGASTDAGKGIFSLGQSVQENNDPEFVRMLERAGFNTANLPPTLDAIMEKMTGMFRIEPPDRYKH